MTDDEFAIRLGERIRELRKLKNISQLELAYDMDMSMNTISGIELGKISPKIETLRKIADRLGIEIGELFDFNLQPNNDKVRRKKIEQFARNLNNRSPEFLTLLNKAIDLLDQAQNLSEKN